MRRALLPALALLTLPLGCSLLQQFAQSNFQTPTLTFKSAALREISLEGATVDLVFTVDNPNEMGLSLAETDYKLLIEGKQLLAGKPPDGLTIPAHGQADVTLPAGVKFAELAQSIAALLTQHTVKYDASGHLGVQTPVGLVTLPLSHSGTLELPRIPEVAINPPRLVDIGLTAATLELSLTVKNPNAFPLPLGSLVGALNIAGADVGSLPETPLSTLAANSETTLKLPLRIGFLQAVSAAQAIRNGSAHVAVKGELHAGSASLPFALERDVDITR